jgi:hypothetical protein
MESSPDSRRFLQPFLSRVKDCDAAFWHLPDLQTLANEPSSLTTSTVTTIRVNVNPGVGAIEFTEADMNYFFQNYVEGLRENASPGESVAFVETRSFVASGRSAYEAAFRIDRPKQGRYYVLLVLVPGRDGSMHMFTLKVDSTRFSARRDEFHGMLRTLRYAK